MAERAADALLRRGGQEVAQRQATAIVERAPRGQGRRDVLAGRVAVHAPERAARSGLGDAGAPVHARARAGAAQDTGAARAIAIAADLLLDEHLERLVERRARGVCHHRAAPLVRLPRMTARAVGEL